MVSPEFAEPLSPSNIPVPPSVPQAATERPAESVSLDRVHSAEEREQSKTGTGDFKQLRVRRCPVPISRRRPGIVPASAPIPLHGGKSACPDTVAERIDGQADGRAKGFQRHVPIHGLPPPDSAQEADSARLLEEPWGRMHTVHPHRHMHRRLGWRRSRVLPPLSPDAPQGWTTSVQISLVTIVERLDCFVESDGLLGPPPSALAFSEMHAGREWRARSVPCAFSFPSMAYLLLPFLAPVGIGTGVRPTRSS